MHMPPAHEVWQYAKLVWQLPRHPLLFTAIGLVSILYFVAFFIERPVSFSYGGVTCGRQLTILPALHKAVDESKFRITFSQGPSFMGMQLLSNETCFHAAQAPKTGSYTIASAPYGGWLARKHFRMHVKATPFAQLAIRHMVHSQ